MQTDRFTVPSLSHNNHALTYDLKNSLTMLDGMSHVDVDSNTGVVTVLYDPAYLGASTILSTIVKSGYPMAAS